MKKATLSKLHSLALCPVLAVLVVASPVLSLAANSLAWDYTILFQEGNQLKNSFPQYVPTSENPSGNSTGSGVTYWPGRDTYLLLDNNPRRLLEFTHENVYIRTITLLGFGDDPNYPNEGDPEDIHFLYGNTFVISKEYNFAHNAVNSYNELVVISLPTSGTSVNISNAIRRLRFPTTSFGNVDNKGIEAVACIGGMFYFTTELAPSSPANSWKVWRVPNSGSGIVTVTPTAMFDVASLLSNNGISGDISGMASDGTDLWLLSADAKRVLTVTTGGTLLADYTLPEQGFTWEQAEGIDLFLDPVDKRMKILLAGEKGGTSGSGVDFMLLTAPGVKLATVRATGGWSFYPFLNNGGSQNYVTTTSAIDTTGLSNPAPQAVYKSLQSELSLQVYFQGLSPTTMYKVRFHLSSINFSGYANVLEDLYSSNGGSPNYVSGITPYNGTFNKAKIVELGAQYPSASGEFWVGVTPTTSGKTVVLSGIEIVPVP